MDQLPGSVPDLGNVREIWDTVPVVVPDLDTVWEIWDILTRSSICYVAALGISCSGPVHSVKRTAGVSRGPAP